MRTLLTLLICGGLHAQVAVEFPLPVLMLIAAVVGASKHLSRPALALRLSMILFALLMLAKMILNARVYHYGFVLALPAALVTIAMLVDWIPALIARWGGDERVFVAAALGAILVTIFIHVRVTYHFMADKTFAVGEGGDTIFSSPARGPAIEQARLDIEHLTPPGATLAVVPEGAMLNYLTRRPSSIPFVAFLPSDLALHDENRINEAFAAHPPDFIAVVPKNQEEYGRGNFGVDYAKDLGTWIRENYAICPQTARNPVKILAHRTAPQTSDKPPLTAPSSKSSSKAD